jgi:hypothetical protein
MKLMPPEKEHILNFIQQVKEEARIGERKSCDKCFNLKEVALNMRHEIMRETA